LININPNFLYGFDTKFLVARLKGKATIESEIGHEQIKRPLIKIPSNVYVNCLNGAYLDLSINKATLVRLKEASKLYLGQDKTINSQGNLNCCNQPCHQTPIMTLLKGLALFHVSPRYSPLPFIIDTPQAIICSNSGRFAVEITDSQSLKIANFSGDLSLMLKNNSFQKNIKIGQGALLSLKANGSISIDSSPTPEQIAPYKECLDLHFGLQNNLADIKHSGRYEGDFFRGYSPGTLLEFGSAYTRQHKSQCNKKPTSKEQCKKGKYSKKRPNR